MAIIRVRAAPSTLDNLVLRVAMAVGDVVDGARPSTADQKFTNARIVRAISDMMAHMYSEMGAQNPDTIVTEASITYTGGSDAVEIGNNNATTYSIYGVFETINGVRTLLRHVDYLMIERFRTEGEEPAKENERVWAQRDEYLLLRPIPANDTTLVLALLDAPFELTTGSLGGTDQHPFPVQHEELLCLGAANRLQYPNDQLPAGRQMHYNVLWQAWQRDCDRYQGPRFPQDTRRWR